MKVTKQLPNEIEVKFYPNRKYYIKELGRYSNMTELAQFIKAGHTVKIVSSNNAYDLTKTHLINMLYRKTRDELQQTKTVEDLIQLLRKEDRLL